MQNRNNIHRNLGISVHSVMQIVLFQSIQELFGTGGQLMEVNLETRCMNLTLVSLWRPKSFPLKQLT